MSQEQLQRQDHGLHREPSRSQSRDEHSDSDRSRAGYREYKNPFPGAQPYRASDQGRFYGREDLAYKLSGTILANRCVTIYGPSGAGKSSLAQASVMPALIASQEIRVVRVDSWPEGEDPTRWLARAIYRDLDLGGAAPALPARDGGPAETGSAEGSREGSREGERSGDLAPGEAIFKAAQRAARRSPRLVIIYLDQIEQLLYASRPVAPIEAFFACIDALADMPLRNLRLVLSLREDYLGRFRDRLRDRRRLLSNGFRVGPLTVAELCDAVCKAAAAGEPPQTWPGDQMRQLMLQVRVPGQAESDEAEAQSAYAQIVCRALFQERAHAGDRTGEDSGPIEAEPILRRYLETTLRELGPMREAAQRLLEDHLITADGGRTVRTERELQRLLSSEDLPQILKALEDAAILHAEEHQGSRYFELGHDWLARKVLEERQTRERAEEQRRREEEQQRELARQRAETEARLAKARTERRRLLAVAATSLAAAVVTGCLGWWAFRQKQAAESARRAAEEQRQIAIEQRQIAVEQRIEANDASILLAFRELRARDQLPMAMELLPEVALPAKRRGWVDLANEALGANALFVTLAGHEGPLTMAAFSRDGARVLSASADGTARIWNADGTGQPVVLRGHDEAVTFAAWSPDQRRVVTASVDGTARVWSADGAGQPVVLQGHAGPVIFAAFSPDGERVITASEDGTARVYRADGSGEATALIGHKGPVYAAIFHPDGAQVFTASADGTVRLWAADGSGKPKILRGHTEGVVFLALSPDGKRLISTSLDHTARLWDASGKGKPLVLSGHEGGVFSAAFRPDGRCVATASGDRTARVWDLDGGGLPVVLRGHDLAVIDVAWSPDGAFVATASADRTARLWHADLSRPPLVLRGHQAAVRTVGWSPDGARVLTADGDKSGRAPSYTAKLWSTDRLRSMPREERGTEIMHAAFIGPDSLHVVSAYDDRTARRWRIDGQGEPVVFRGHEPWVASATLSPDGEHVVTASFDRIVRIYNADGQGEPIELGRHAAPVRYAAFSPDGARIVTAGDDRTARVFRADGAGTPVLLQGHEDWLSSAAWSPDGARIVTTSLDRTARVWNADGSGAPVVLSGHTGEVYAAAWSPDGVRVVTASEDHTARIWNADGIGKPTRLRGHEGAVLHAAFSQDGARVVTSSADSTVRVFRVDGEGEPIVLDTPAPALAVAFLPGGQEILTVASDGTARRYMVDIDALRQRLLTAHADCVPPAIRASYLSEPWHTARERFASCERAHGRTPSDAEDKTR